MRYPRGGIGKVPEAVWAPIPRAGLALDPRTAVPEAIKYSHDTRNRTVSDSGCVNP
jgi:hypothetical protein